MIKLLTLSLFISSCSVLETATSSFSTMREIGKMEGRNEVMQALKKNKEDLKQLSHIIMTKITDTTLFDEEKQHQELITMGMALTALLNDRKKLKEKLKELANTPLSEPAND